MTVSNCVLLSLLLLPVSISQNDPLPVAGKVTVMGRVVDLHGEPVAGAKVDAYPFSGYTGMFESATTAADGTFAFHVYPYGDAEVSASKPQAGYPDGTNALYGRGGHESVQRINATVAMSPIHVELRFGEPEATADWKVLSKTDQTPVRFVTYSVAWSDDPKVFSRGSTSNVGIFRFVLPQHPVQITVGAPGFRNWNSAESREFAGPVLFTGGTRDERTILLEPQDR
jgi:hypothetical protein